VNRSVIGRIAGLGLVLVLAAGCAVQTGEFLKTRDSNYGQVGDLQLLHVHLATPPREGWQPGARVPLHLTVVNRGADRVAVTEVSSPGAGAVALVGADEPIALDPGETLSLQEGDAARLEVDGLTSRLTAGTTLPVEFRLDTGEEIVLAVPAQVSSDPVVRSR
jgi:copper(I)-binding protein